MAVLGVDIGTSSCRAMAFDAGGRALSFAAAPMTRTHAADGRAEIGADALLVSFEHAVVKAAETAGQPVRALACSVFGGALTALDESGQPLLPVISTTDCRAVPEAREWEAHFGRTRTYEICGLPISPTLNLLKIMSVRRERPEVFARARVFVSPGEMVLHTLGAPARIDLSAASTWMALDLQRGCWSREVLAAAQIDESLLPEIVRSGQVIGRIDEPRLGLPSGTALVAGGHDQQVCALGAGLTGPGVGVDSLGSVECIVTAFRQPRFDSILQDGNYACLHHVHGGLFVILAYSFGAGDLLRWCLAALAWPPGHGLPQLVEGLPDGPGPLLALPHFAGSGPPTLDALSRGAILGLSLASTPAEIVLAVVEAQNYEMRLSLDIWEQIGLRPRELRAHGGGSQSDRLLQLKADILNVPVHRLSVREAGCLGAAALAAAAIGEVQDPTDFLRQVRVERSFEPRPGMHARYEERYRLYRRLYEQVSPISHSLAQRLGDGHACPGE